MRRFVGSFVNIALSLILIQDVKAAHCSIKYKWLITLMNWMNLYFLEQAKTKKHFLLNKTMYLLPYEEEFVFRILKHTWSAVSLFQKCVPALFFFSSSDFICSNFIICKKKKIELTVWKNIRICSVHSHKALFNAFFNTCIITFPHFLVH